jgi:hypothetical protein
MTPTKPATIELTVHHVLAGAYRAGGVERTLLSHLSADGGITAVCHGVKADSLCDQVEEGAPTCPKCRVVYDR